MTEIQASDIQLFMFIPMLIDDDYYRILDPDELVDQTYVAALQNNDTAIGHRHIPEMYQPLFLTEDFKAVFRPTALDLMHVNPERSVQAVVPSLNIVVQLKWRFELLCNLALLVLEIQTPSHTSMSQLNDLLNIAQHDTFTWSSDNGWLLPHHSITQMLDVPPDEALGLAHLVSGFEKLLGVHAIVSSQTPMVSFLLQMNIRGGADFQQATDNFGEYLLRNRYRHLSALLAYHETQQPYMGTIWHCAQTLDQCGWIEWQPPQHRDTSLTQHRYAAGNIYTSSIDRRRAARRVFKICTMEYVAARLMAHLLASKGEARQLRAAIQQIFRDKGKSDARYYDVVYKLSRLEARYVLLNTNITNPDWVLDNPFGEGNHFIELMQYMTDAYATKAHTQALRQQLNLFSQMLDRCQ